MPEIRVINLSGHRDEYGPSLELRPDIAYIGRRLTMGGWRLPETKWANPFRIGKEAKDAAEAVAMFEEWLPGQPDLIADALDELGGKAFLGCWCTGPCHGRTWARILNGARPVANDFAESDCGDSIGDELVWVAAETVRFAPGMEALL